MPLSKKYFDMMSYQIIKKNKKKRKKEKKEKRQKFINVS